MIASPVIGSPIGALAVDDQGLEFFENQVRPLLVDNCVRCHGSEKQKGGLRLDSVQGILEGGEGGSILVPGDLDASRMIQAVRYLDEDLQMPPRRKLESTSILALESWVSAGAQMPAAREAHAAQDPFDLQARLKHWSFQPLSVPRVPIVSDQTWATGDVDRFLLARLEQQSLVPAPDAEPIDWLRRVHYALIGLPPTTQEVHSFLRDRSPTARETVVDGLLESPHFGERWGRHWLDLVRYAETRGHEFDIPIPNAWQYRDYVVRAFNSDVPYDRFVQEHVAGDLLESPRMNSEAGFNESLLATGFWFLGDGAHSPVDIRADETDRVANQVDVFSRAFLALTVACARCHDHKFDPLSAEDYYALSGFVMGGSYRQARFETVLSEGRTAVALQELQAQHRPGLRASLAEALAQVSQSRQPLMGQARAYLGTLVASDEEPAPEPDEAAMAEIAEAQGLNAAQLASWVAELQLARDRGHHPLHHWYHGTEPPKGPVAPAADLPGLFDRDAHGQPLLLQDGHGAGDKPQAAGTLLLGHDPARAAIGLLDRDAMYFDSFWRRSQLAEGTEGEPTATKGVLPGRMFRTPTFEVQQGKLSVLVRGKGFVYAAVDLHRIVRGPLHAALCQSIDTGGAFRWVVLNLDDYVGHRVHLEFSPHRDAAPSLAVAGFLPGPPAGRALHWGRLDFAGAALRVLDEGTGDLGEHALVDWMLQHPELFPLAHDGYRSASAAYCAELEELADQQTWVSHAAPVMLEGSGVDEFLLLRGNAGTPRGLAHRRFLEALGGKDAAPIEMGSGRLQLAEQLTSPENPFLSRVWVNRIWHYMFDRGLVASVDDFGQMGEVPSHPELLDYLARTLISEGWSTKSLIRRLVLTRAFGMSSRANPAAKIVDPENRLLHRMPVHRLDAEALRDGILAVSGGLNRTLHGPSVPVHLTATSEGGRGRPARSGPLDGDGRRSLYLSVRRNFPVAFLGVFDFPNPATTMGRRGHSNVPSQALTLLNDPFVQEQASRWAERLLGIEPSCTDEQRLLVLYLEALGREPDESEARASLEFLKEREELGASILGGWADLCHVIFNTKEFRYLR